MADAPITNTDLWILIPTTLKAAIEATATAQGKLVNDWIVQQLEAAVPAELLATVRQEANDAYSRQKEASREEELDKMARWPGRD